MTTFLFSFSEWSTSLSYDSFSYLPECTNPIKCSGQPHGSCAYFLKSVIEEIINNPKTLV